MKSTKNKLLSSIATLCVCFAMLIGSTYAWFTDSASTGVNKIQSGNLDVQLLVHNGTDYVDVEQNPDNPLSLFDVGTSNVAQNNNQDTLWEPGKTQVAYLQIKNKGNLDLKYSVVVEVVDPAESKDLYEVMQYSIVNDATPSNGLVTSWTGSGTSVAKGNNATSAKDVILKKTEAHNFGLAIHMDERAGNTYKDGKVEFYIHVYAAQLTSEKDSFNDQYDVNAQYPVELNARVSVNSTDNTVSSPVTVSTAEKVSGKSSPVATVTVPVGVKMEAGKSTITTSITQTSAPSSMASKISVTSDSKTFEVTAAGIAADNQTNGKPLTVIAYIGTGLSNVKLYHNGSAMIDKTNDPTGLVNNQDYKYDSTTGYITFLSSSFSPFTATYDKESWDKHAAESISEAENVYSISTAAELAKFAKMVNEDGKSFSGKTVQVAADIDLGEYLWKPVGQTGATQFMGTFDGNGHTISNLLINNTDESGNCSSGLFGWLNSATVKNLNINTATVTGHHNVGVVAGYLETDGCTIENVHVSNANISCISVNNDANGDKCGGIVGHAGNGGVSVKNCTVSNATISAGRDAGQVVGAALEANVTGCSATNVTVTANGTSTGANIRNEVIGRVLS